MTAQARETREDNPWLELDLDGYRDGEPWYVLPEDEATVLRNNARYGPGENPRIQTQLMPEPYLGRLNAPVVFLNLNPGYTPGLEERWHANPELKEAFRRNFTQGELPYPHIFLDPRFRESPGGMWWWDRLRHLIEHCTREKVARNLLALEYFPYHSRAYPNVRVPSDEFARCILRNAMDRGATIIVARRWNDLVVQLPELLKYPCLRTASNQNVILTPRNLPGFWDVVERIKIGA